jgi:hypothetical protein
MTIVGAVLSILGLVLDLVAGLILLPNIFITDREIRLLAQLPIEESTSHMTGADSRKTLPVAVTDVTKLREYRDRYIEARKEERKKGKLGLGVLIIGFFLQIVGQILPLL